VESGGSPYVSAPARGDARGMRRIAPAVGLVLLAPLVAEFLLGNLPITLLPALVLLAPMYGGGALLIREVTRRAGRGVPTMLLLGLAYGLVEEGIATQSLFNPHYVGADLLGVGYVPWLGIAVPWTLFVVTLHAVGSTTVPIVTAELCTRVRRTTPWLGRAGSAVAAVLFVVGVAGNAAFQMGNDPFRATPAQFAGVVVLAALAAVVGLRLPRRAGLPGGVPAAWVIGLVGLAAGVAGELAPLSYAGVAVLAALWVVLAVLGARWVTRAAWTPRHTLAATAAALATYAWHAFPESPVVPVPAVVDLVGNAVFALGAVLLIGTAWRRTAAASTIVISSPPSGRHACKGAET
jgi:hypothetical protein